LDLDAWINGSRQGTAHGTRSGLARALVAAQVALSVVILMSAGLLVRTLQNLRHIDIGLTPERLLVIDIDPKSAGYTKQTYASICDRLLRRIAALPGINSATFSQNGLFTGRDSTSDLRAEGRTARGGRDQVFYDTVGPRYFATLGIPLVMGRDFSERDRAGTERVIIVNEEFAKSWPPGLNPIGHRVIQGAYSFKVIAVARDVRDHDLRGEVKPYCYMPYFQFHESDPFSMRFMVRTAAAPERVAGMIRQAVAAEDKTLPIVSVATASDLIDRTIVQERLIATLSGGFAVLALSLVGVGLYGVVAYRVVRRTAEIGIRMALGAQRGTVMRMVLGESLMLVFLGTAVGLPIAVAACQELESLLFGLSPADVTTTAVSVILIIGVGLFAGWIPARRASRIDPMRALKYE
jgi:predicted permease